MKWYLKQLLPLSYNTVCTEKGQKKVYIWNMFLGKCYNVKAYEVR